MRNRFLALCLLLPLALTGCGVANIDQPLVEPPEDVTAPRIESIKFDKSQLSGTVITLRSLVLKRIVIEFSEPLDPDSLVDTVVSTTPELPGSWAYNAETRSIEYSLDPDFKLDYNQSYRLTISGTLRDQAGNTLLSGDYELTILTPAAYPVAVEVSGLQNGASLDVTLRNDILGDSETATLAGGSTESFTFAMLIPQRYTYSIVLGAASNGQICTGAGSFAMGQRAVTVALTCSDVLPRYSNAPDWNDYLQGKASAALPADQAACDNAAGDCFHGAEYRVFPISDFASCDGLIIEDALGVFDWICQSDEQGRPQAVSTGLKPGKGLADLLDFTTDPVSWADNQVIVRDGNGNSQRSAASAWWRNPILPAARNMDRSGAVYVYAAPDYDISDYNSLGATSKVALVIKPGVKLLGVVNFDSLSAASAKDFLWIEGAIDANGADTGLNLAYARHARLHGVSVLNAAADAIVVTGGRHLRLQQVAAVHNGGNGITLTDTQAASLQQIRVADNGGHGLALLGDEDSVLAGLNSSSNQGHGLLADGSINARMTQVLSTGNGGDGVRVGGDAPITGGNYLAAVTTADNEGAGLRLTAASGLNTVTNLLVVGNAGSGVELDTDKGNVLRRAQLADNGTDCVVDGAAVCGDEMAPIDAADLFVGAVADDANAQYFSSSASQRSRAALDAAVAGAPSQVLERWSVFESPLRNWTCDANAMCMLMDWSLKAGAVALGADSVSAVAETHGFAKPSRTVEVLPNAIELLNDGAGNDDGLCEADETCLLAANAGAYVGHGALQDRPLAAGESTPFNVNLKRLANNGY